MTAIGSLRKGTSSADLEENAGLEKKAAVQAETRHLPCRLVTRRRLHPSTHPSISMPPATIKTSFVRLRDPFGAQLVPGTMADPP